jgi:signal transduction histidine kinase
MTMLPRFAETPPPKRILVIDDDDGLRMAVRGALNAGGYEAVEAGDGLSGINLLESDPPDLVLCDIGLGVGDGFDVLAAVRENPALTAIPFILMTAQVGEGIMRQSMDSGADDYLQKPFTPEQLLHALEARLKKSEALERHAARTTDRLLKLLEATADLVAILDPETRNITYLNRAGRELVGRDPRRKRTQVLLTDLYPPEALVIVESQGIPAALREGAWNGETVLRDRAGVQVHVSQQILTHLGPGGRLDCLFIVAHNIMERMRAEEERLCAEIQSRQTQKMESIGRLAAGIAHEINTPTQFIGDNLRFLQQTFGQLESLVGSYHQLLQACRQGVPPAELTATVQHAADTADLEFIRREVPASLGQALEGVGRVASIVRALKEFAHPGTEEKSPADLKQLIESTITVSRNEWKYVADLVADFDPELPLVPCLPGQLNQVILNLLVNAGHAIADVVGDGMSGRGCIRVSTRRVDHWAEIRISDTGAGIPAHIREHVFEPFFTTKQAGKGTGQGLAIAHTVVVNRHGGTIHFESEPGRGTTFIVRLPLASPDPPAV